VKVFTGTKLQKKKRERTKQKEEKRGGRERPKIERRSKRGGFLSFGVTGRP